MINQKNAKELRRGIRGAYKINLIPKGILPQAKSDANLDGIRGDYRTENLNTTTALLDKQHPRALYKRAKRGLLASKQTIRRAR